jgi:HPt (histidine-containing phosphotransfer) domain-containing protein
MVHEMIQCFYDDVRNLFPLLHSAVEKGNLEEASRLGHRIKGTILYLGAHQAVLAAMRVEQLNSKLMPENEAREVVENLQRACDLLKSALSAHPLAVDAV